MMEANTNLRISRFISSQQTGYSGIQKRSISLGKTIVKELDLEPRVDTLSRWMVHSIAEQVIITKSMKGTKKSKAKNRCFEIFKKLQQHQSSTKYKLSSFDRMKPIIKILKKIDPKILSQKTCK